jgi:predicted nucleic acid-binding Zn ribbon protein
MRRLREVQVYGLPVPEKIMSVYRNRPKETSQRGRWFLAVALWIAVVVVLTT